MRKEKKEGEILSRAFVAKLLLSSFIFLLVSSSLFAEGPAQTLETQKDKESYSIGYQVGLSMKTDGVKVDFEKLIQGMHDATDGKVPRLSVDEMRNLIVDLKKRANEVQMRRLQELIVKNAQESEKFLEENKKKEGIKTTESGLQYKVLTDGDGPTPKPEDFVKVNYRGTFIDGTEFDSSYAKGEPQTIQTDGVIKGWTEALQLMKVGSKWMIFVPPQLAYGRGGLGERIPPNKVLVFEIELLSIEKGDKAAELSSMKPGQPPTVRKINITGEIAKGEHGYIIRSKKGDVLSTIFTILNPDPKILDEFVRSERTVPIEVRIVSGDNIEIEKLDGKEYR